MIRGANAQFKFKLPYNYDDLNVAKIIFWQKGNSGPDATRPLPIIKNLEQCAPSSDIPNELNVILNQEETLRFSDKNKAYVQLRATSIDGSTFASKEELITVYPLYDDSILGDIVTPTPGDEGYSYFDGGIIE